jgi:hypothetical protein
MPLLSRLLAALLLCACASAQPAPDAPYSPKSGLTLTDSEQSILAAAKPAPTLTNKGVLTLVTTTQVDRLKAKADGGGRMDDADRALAARLYWTRGQVLSDADAEFLRALNPMALSSAARAPPGDADQAAGLPAVGPPVDAARADKALAGLKKLVTTDDHGNATERAALDDAFTKMVHTRTGLELSEEWIAQGKPAKVSFEATNPLGTGVVETNGVKTLQSSGGYTSRDGSPWVHLNKEYLDTSPSYRGPEVAGTLAHELLGHGLVFYKSKAAGAWEANEDYRNDEGNAGMTGWLVSAEAGAKLADGHMWTFLGSQEAYHKSLQTNLPYYAGIFSLDEMKDPVGTLEQRRLRIAADAARLPQQRVDQAQHRKDIEHFITVHGLSRDKFKSLIESARNLSVWTDAHEKNLKEIDTYVGTMLAYWKGPTGQKAAAKMAEESKLPYFADAEARLNAMTTRLQDLTAGKKPQSFTPPPPPDQYTNADLSAMIVKDKQDHPDHWTTK